MTKTLLRSLLFCFASICLFMYAFMDLVPCLYIAIGCIVIAIVISHTQKK